jgi:ABC-type Fe3+-hydroxamate transport system substrate-binding protein
MKQSASWAAIPAVHAGRVLVYDTALVGRPSVQLGAAAYSLARLLHPNEVK